MLKTSGNQRVQPAVFEQPSLSSLPITVGIATSEEPAAGTSKISIFEANQETKDVEARSPGNSAENWASGGNVVRPGFWLSAARLPELD
jgi:hypothetical protein